MIEIYGRKDCVWCERAKNLVTQRNLTYTYLSMPEDISVEEFKEKFPGRKTVPQILVDGVLLDDGYTSLSQIINDLQGDFNGSF